jgi:Gpi18-like mannosyltransferase
MARAKTALSLKTLLIFGFLIRLIFLPLAYHDDVTSNYWWGRYALDFSLRGYYDWLDFTGYAPPDQPPFYILYYRCLRSLYLLIYRLFWWLNITIPVFPSKFMQWYFLWGNQFIQKIPTIFVDMFIIFALIRLYPQILKRKNLLLCLIFFPPFIYNSSLWGGNEMILNLFYFSSFYFLLRSSLVVSVIFLTLGLLFKSSLLIFLPLYLIALIKVKPKPSRLFLAILFFLLITYLLSSPFAVKPTFIWLADLFQTKILPGSMPHLTANAFNLWTLLFGLSPRQDNLLIFNFLTARAFSFIFWLVLVCPLLFNLYSRFSLRRLLLSMATVTLLSFFFLTRMHERYTFPAFIPLFILSIKQCFYYKYLLILTVTHLLNVYNFWWVPQISFLITLLQFGPVINLISLFNLFILSRLYLLQLNSKSV